MKNNYYYIAVIDTVIIKDSNVDLWDAKDSKNICKNVTVYDIYKEYPIILRSWLIMAMLFNLLKNREFLKLDK